MTGDEERVYLQIVEWRRFQHYHEPRPRWIKTHVSLLSSDEYLRLTPARRALLHGLWLEYAATCTCPEDDQHLTCTCLRLDVHLLNRRLALAAKMADYESLNDAGFVRFYSRVRLEKLYSSSRPEREKYLENHLEKGSSVEGNPKAVTELDQATPETNGTHPEPTERPEEEIENIKELIEQAMRGAP